MTREQAHVAIAARVAQDAHAQVLRWIAAGDVRTLGLLGAYLRSSAIVEAIEAARAVANARETVRPSGPPDDDGDGGPPEAA